MEESPGTQMDTDVSSTTQDGPLPEQNSGPSGTMEVTVVVDEVKPEDKEIVVEEQDERIDSNTPEKVPQPPVVDQRPPVRVIVIKKTKSSVKPADLDCSLLLKGTMESSNENMEQSLAKDSVQSSNKMTIVKAQTSVSQTQAQKSPEKDAVKTTNIMPILKAQTSTSPSQPLAKKTPEKPLIIKKAPEKTLVLLKPNDDTITILKNSITDVQAQKTPENTSPVQKSPLKESEVQDKPVGKPVKVVEPLSKELQASSKASKSTEMVSDDKQLQNDPKGKGPENSSIVEQPTNPEEQTEFLHKEAETATAVAIDAQDEKEISDDSQSESVSSASKKDISDDSQSESVTSGSNKSISRELKSLINSAKESKIISECTQVKTKTRKSRSNLDSSNIVPNTSTDPEKIQSNRRESCNSQESSCSEKSEQLPLKRPLRVRSRTNTPSKVQSEDREPKGTVAVVVEKPAENDKPEAPVTISKKVNPSKEGDTTKANKLRTDPYCWRCHYAVELAPNEKAHPPAYCTVCPRAFHFKCLTGPERTKLDKDSSWVCPKCMTILHAESSETRSPVMKKITLGMLCDLLKYALKRMMEVNGVEPFMAPVDRVAFPDYDKYVVHAVDLGLMKESITAGVYGSTEAFVSDAQWILHNSIIFNTLQSKLTAAAKALVRSCRTEMAEIEACPECYAAAHARRPTWFTDVCSNPHVLLWAKLKGFPYWPAKGMSVNTAGMVDARFFGAHDRAWVPARDCFLYSERDPNAFRTMRHDIIESMQEAQQHIANITRKFGKFIYPAFKVPFEPARLNEQIKMMIPSFEPETVPEKPKPFGSPSPVAKGRSASKGSKDSFADGGTSDDELPTVEKKRKTSEFVEIEVPSIVQNTDNNMVETPERRPQKKKRTNSVLGVGVTEEKQKEKEADKHVTRKRRRSALEEATATVMTPEHTKRQKIAKFDTPDKSKPKAAEDKNEVKGKDTSDVVKTYSKAATSSPKPTQVEALKETKDKSGSTSPMTTRASTPASASKQANKPTPKATAVKEADKAKKPNAAQREKSVSSEKEKEKDDKARPKRDRTTKGNHTPKSAKKKSDGESSSSNNESDSNKDKNTPIPKGKSTVDSTFDEENTSLAILSKKNSGSSLPTITNVRSLSAQADASKNADTTKTTSKSNIFTPTSTENVSNPKEGDRPIVGFVGRVGVRSFARMTSPPAQRDSADKEQVEVEVKTEPMDLDDADRQSEKIDFVNTIRLRPVNPMSVQSLRDIRITKVASTTPTAAGPVVTARKQIVVATNEIRPKARKTFPQPQKANEGVQGRSELNSKNSMVYIPIQPPNSQAPRPPVRIHSSSNGPGTSPVIRPHMTIGSTSSNNIVNTMTTPLMTVVTMPPSSSTVTTLTQVPNIGTLGPLGQMGQLGALGQVPQVGQVPTTVHTVPLITSVNGQWTFSLQPMMSVGGVDRSQTPPLSNGIPEPPLAQLSPLVTMSSPVAPVAPAPPAAPALPVILPKPTDPGPGELPRLQQKPTLFNPLDPNAPATEVPTPSAAGPITARLNQNAAKLSDFFRKLLEDSIDHLDYNAASITALKKDIERLKWNHQQRIDELKHNHELQLTEMRSMMEKEKARAVSETRRSMTIELTHAVKQAKSRQWCAYCQQEAQFYCCWNTSYCDYPCQRAHWVQHCNVCTQQRFQDGNRDGADLTQDRLQPSDNPPALKKPAVGATVTVGGKVLQSRLLCQNTSNQTGKPSIIVSMVEDTGGNPTVKCLGTYKPPQPTSSQSTPLLINKQLMNSEENTAKKVVTSGGYLIVGASNATNTNTVIIN